MYVINRKSKERLKIGDTIITILSSNRVKLGIEAPTDVKVERLPAVNDAPLPDQRPPADAPGPVPEVG